MVSPTDDHVHAPVNSSTATVYAKQLDTINPLDTKQNCVDDVLGVPTVDSVASAGCETNKPMTHVMSVLDPESTNFPTHVGEKSMEDAKREVNESAANAKQMYEGTPKSPNAAFVEVREDHPFNKSGKRVVISRGSSPTGSPKRFTTDFKPHQEKVTGGRIGFEQKIIAETAGVPMDNVVVKPAPTVAAVATSTATLETQKHAEIVTQSRISEK